MPCRAKKSSAWAKLAATCSAERSRAAILVPHSSLYGLDDLVWRSLVWAARKPFVLRGMPQARDVRRSRARSSRHRPAAAGARCPRQRRERELGEVGFEEILEIGVLRGLGVDQDQSARVRSCGDRRHSGQNQENNDRSAFRTFSGSNHGGFRSARAP